MGRIRNINSIHVFDSVAKLGSVTKAALSAAAPKSSVSYHIKKLEADLGVSLFRRTAHGLQLTEEGSTLAAHVDAGLHEISLGIEQVARRQSVVRVAWFQCSPAGWSQPTSLDCNRPVLMSMLFC